MPTPVELRSRFLFSSLPLSPLPLFLPPSLLPSLPPSLLPSFPLSLLPSPPRIHARTPLGSRPLTPLSDPMSGFFGMRRAAFERGRKHVSPLGFKIGLELYVKCQCKVRALCQVPMQGFPSPPLPFSNSLPSIHAGIPLRSLQSCLPEKLNSLPPARPRPLPLSQDHGEVNIFFGKREHGQSKLTGTLVPPPLCLSLSVALLSLSPFTASVSVSLSV